MKQSLLLVCIHISEQSCTPYFTGAKCFIIIFMLETYQNGNSIVHCTVARTVDRVLEFIYDFSLFLIINYRTLI